MREVAIQDVGAALERCIERASFTMDPALREALSRGEKAERNCTGCAILDQLLRNADIAQAERRPLCQDTGVAVVYLDIGQEVRLTGGGVEEGVNAAVREAYRKFALRPSITRHPLRRVNTGDNTPAVIHMRITPGDRVRVEFLAKGGGCENMSRLAMLKPSDGREGVMEFVLRAVRESGGNACPPLVVGVGIGGNFG
ncbi:MAG: fumarate hydratase, partial [Kiritimatiellae bacterium]|nr:fumarate hydratase [Kiritimatiellia bacterium]